MKNISILGTGQARIGASDGLANVYSAKVLKRMPAYARSGLAAVTTALKNANRFPCPESSALVIGTSCGCQKTSFDFMDSIINAGTALASPLAFSHSVNNVGAGLISCCLGIHGPVFTINNGSASLSAALQTTIALLRSGRCSMAIVGQMEDADKRMERALPFYGQQFVSYFMILECTRVDS